MKIHAMIVALLFLFAVVLYAEARTWTDVKGNTFEASIVGLSKHSGRIILELPYGEQKVFRISQFSEDDRNYIEKKFPKRKSTGTSSGGSSPATVTRSGKPRNETTQPKAEIDMNSSRKRASGGVRVVVEGYGENVEEAKQDAIRTAVEQVVGMLVDAQMRTEYDEVVEKIFTATGAYVKSNKVLKATMNDGICTVQLEAFVVKNAISEKLKSVNRGSSMKIDGGAIFDKMESKVQSEKDGVMFLANFLKEEQFPYSLLDVSFDGKPKVEQKAGNYTYTVDWTVRANMTRYREFIKKLTVILNKVAIGKKTFILDLERDSDGDLFYDEDSIPNKENFYLNVCTSLTGSTNKHAKFVQYKLPEKYKYLFLLYGMALPAVEINLLDSDKELVASQRRMLQYELSTYSGYPLFNLSNSLKGNDDYYYYEKTSKDDSTLAKPDGDQPNSRAIVPFMVLKDYDHYYVCESVDYDITFEISSEDLKKVSSAEIHVVANNPDMDNVYETLEWEIDNVVTE